MPQKNMSHLGGLIGDLYRETSFSVFLGTIVGMIVGFIGTLGVILFWLVAMGSMVARPTQPAQPYGANTRTPGLVVPVGSPGTGRAAPVLFLLVVPGMIGGGMIGCLFGVILDFGVKLVRGPQVQEKRRGKKWVPERDAKPRPEPPPEVFRGTLRSHAQDDTNDHLRPGR